MIVLSYGENLCLVAALALWLPVWIVGRRVGRSRPGAKPGQNNSTPAAF